MTSRPSLLPKTEPSIMIKQVLTEARALYVIAASRPAECPCSPGCRVVSTISEAATALATRHASQSSALIVMKLYSRARDAVADATGAASLVVYSANHTTEEVLAAFDIAIARAV